MHIMSNIELMQRYKMALEAIVVVSEKPQEPEYQIAKKALNIEIEEHSKSRCSRCGSKNHHVSDCEVS